MSFDLDELEALSADLGRLHLGWAKDSKTPALLDDLSNIVVVFPPSDKQTAAAVYFGAVRPEQLKDLIALARDVSEWREADAAWYSMSGDTSVSALQRLELAEARLRGTDNA